MTHYKKKDLLWAKNGAAMHCWTKEGSCNCSRIFVMATQKFTTKRDLLRRRFVFRNKFAAKCAAPQWLPFVAKCDCRNKSEKIKTDKNPIFSSRKALPFTIKLSLSSVTILSPLLLRRQPLLQRRQHLA